MSRRRLIVEDSSKAVGRKGTREEGEGEMENLNQSSCAGKSGGRLNTKKPPEAVKLGVHKKILTAHLLDIDK